MDPGAQLHDLDSAERLRLTPVFPVEADLLQDRVSLFHPVGAGILGRRVGDRINWTVPYGVRCLEVKAVTPKAKAAATKAA
jgi:regulator of nucleoside diphosphate kinase